MITQDDLDSLRSIYDRDMVRDGIIRRLVDAYEEQLDNALKAWRTVRAMSMTERRRPSDREEADREIAKLEEVFK